MDTELFDRVRQGFGKRLSAEGWMLLEQQRPFDPPGVGTFALALRDGFLVTAMVVDRYDEDEPGTLAVSAIGVVGFDYEPARKLTTALTGFAHRCGRSATARPETSCGCYSGRSWTSAMSIWIRSASQ